MIPLVLMAGRNKSFIKILGVPYDNFNIFHSWFGRMVIAFSIIHTVVEFQSIIINGNMGKAVKIPGYILFTNTLKEVRFIALASL